MSIPGPPSFDDFFNKQAHSRSSTGEQAAQPPPILQQQHPSNPSFSQPLGTDLPVMEEPRSLSRRGSSASLHGRRANSSDRMRGMSGDEGFRKESLPFDPESSSTLIATATHAHGNGQSPQLNRQGRGQSIGDIMFPSTSPRYAYTPQPDQQQHPMNAHTQNWNMGGQAQAQYASTPGQSYMNRPSPFDLSTGTPQTDSAFENPGTGSSGADAFVMDQQSPYPSATYGHAQQQSGDWGSGFLGHENAHTPGASGQGFGWNQAENDGAMGGMLGIDDQLNELERIISNSQHGSRGPSRSASPFQADSNMEYNQMPDPNMISQAFESAVSSRSTSPYAQHTGLPQVVSPPASASFQRAGSSPHLISPFSNKPQSPPALIIPNQNQHTPSPSLPPIVTIPTDNAGQGQQQHQRRQSQGGGSTSGGLFPPVNPALEGLTGMAGISPIAPNADGPMIYIQPSTPISALKDGRGIFDFRRVAQGTQQPQGQQTTQGEGGFHVPAPASHSLSGQSGDQLPTSPGPEQQSGQQQGQTDFSNQINFQQQTGGQDWNTNPMQNQMQWGLRPNNNMRPRAKSDSQMGAAGAEMFNRQAFIQGMGSTGHDNNVADIHSMVDHWRSSNPSNGQQVPAPTVDPRSLPGQDNGDALNQFNLSQQFAQLQAQRDRLPALNTGVSLSQSGVFKYEPGQLSPTSMAYYQQLGLNNNNSSHLEGSSSAPYFQSTFQNISQENWPQTAGPAVQSFLSPDQPGIGPRRRSFAEGTNHPAAGAGTPGYGVEFTSLSPFGTLSPGRVRGVSPGGGHRRAAKSEDSGRGGTGWGMGAGGSTSDFLTSITATDGHLLPPTRGRSHSRHSSASSVRSASPALSISSQGSSFSHQSPRMDMPEGVRVPQLDARGKPVKVRKMKVTSMATEVASSSRRTNDGVFKCPVPGCGSTFTRHFNLKGHLRSHNDERPYKCLYDGCPKSVIGFARQHDCKRHMLLHEGLRPFECEGCGKKFARLDALTRHHKSEQGQECAESHPLPTNADGSPMSESQYKAYRAAQHNAQGGGGGGGGQGGTRKRVSSFGGHLSADDRSGGEEDLGTGSGMEEYDRSFG